MMKFAYTIAYVADVEASLAFLSGPSAWRAVSSPRAAALGELETGATALAFAQHDTARGNLGIGYVAADTSAAPLGVEIGLVTTDVDAACERAVAAGAVLLAPSKTKPWGQTVAYVRCPDGTLVELCTAIG